MRKCPVARFANVRQFLGRTGVVLAVIATGVVFASTASAWEQGDWDADPSTGYAVYYEGNWIPIGGTNPPSPLWQAFIALTNADAACRAPSGYENRALYQVNAQCAAVQPTVTVDVGAFSQNSFYKINNALSGSAGGVPIPVLSDPTTLVPTSEGNTGFVIGAEGSVPVLLFPLFGTMQTSPPKPASSTGPVMYAPEDKHASGFPSVLPTKAPPKPSQPPRFIIFNLEAGIYGFAGGRSTINGIPGGPGITPGGNDSFNFRDNFMVTAGGAIVVPVTPSLTAAVTGGFAGVDKTVTFNCQTYCVNGVPVPTFSASKDVFLPGAYVGGRLQWPIAIAELPGAALTLQYKHVFAFGENVSLGSVAQGRIVGFNVAQSLDLLTAGVSIPLGRH